jgi:energy-coupling factor transporter ATP-binding protein EcfA2
MLTIEHLTKTYGDKKAVDDLSLHIAPGEIYGFIGHNGAGKTTTLKSCAGILPFDEGTIRIDGKDIVADATLLPMLAKLYDGVVDATSPEASKARIVVLPHGNGKGTDPRIAAAIERGQRVLEVSGWNGKPNVSLGWWSMGNQVGTALSRKSHVLSGLPHEGVMTPLLFRVVKEGAHPLSAGGKDVEELIIVGEGRKDCYLYLGKMKGGRHIESFGLDILSGTPEGTAILDGIIEELRR